MSRVIADGLSKRATTEFAASETDAGFVEKATTGEAEAGTADKYPDAAGVHAAFNQYGLGDRPFNKLNDANLYIENGFYFVSTIPNLPTENDAYWLDVFGSAATGTQHQIAINRDDTTQYIRRHGASWGSWYQIYNQSSILGPVSQSAGVPTGAVIERGSNANGSYTKFADGTMICTIFNVIGDTVISGSTSFMDYDWTFPVGFINTDIACNFIHTVQSNIDDANRGGDWESAAMSASVVSARYFAPSGNTFTSTESFSASLHAVGRWF